MDTAKTITLKVGDIIAFNEDAHIHRHSTVFGKIVSVNPKGNINFVKLPAIKSEEEANPVYDTCVITPDVAADVIRGSSHHQLTPKRGKQAGPGKYRYQGKDVYVQLYDPTRIYKDENCY